MLGEIRVGHGRQHRNAILVALAAADDDLVGGEVDVLDSEPAALEHPEPGAVEQAGHEARHPVEPLEHGAYLVAREDDRQPLGALRAHDAVEPWEVDLQHVPVQEQKAAQRLVLGGGGDVPVDCQGREELRDFRRAHLGGVALVGGEDVAPGLANVRLLRPAAHVPGAEGLADAVEEARARGLWSASFAEGPRGDVPAARWQLGVLDRRAGFDDGHHRHSAPCGRGV